MEFKEFVDNIQIMDKPTSMKLRKRYIDRFIDNNNKLYNEQIKQKRKFIDGYCYIGYLWDYLIHKEIVNEEYIESALKNKNQVYVFWDIHSSERIFIKNYWRFDKEAMLKMKFDILLSGLEFLPEDIYIFDDTMEWTFVYTHEEICTKRYCIKSVNLQ